MNYKIAYTELCKLINSNDYTKAKELINNNNKNKIGKICNLRDKCGSCIYFNYNDGYDPAYTIHGCTNPKKKQPNFQVRTNKKCKHYEQRNDVCLEYEYSLGYEAKDIRKCAN